MWHAYSAETSRRPCPPSPTSVMASMSMLSLTGGASSSASDDEAASGSDDSASGSEDANSGSDSEAEAPVEPVTYTMEVCMTELCNKAATTFFHGAVGTTASEVTDASGAQRASPPARTTSPVGARVTQPRHPPASCHSPHILLLPAAQASATCSPTP